MHDYYLSKDYNFTASFVKVAQGAKYIDSASLRSIKVKSPSDLSMAVKVGARAGANLLPVRISRIMRPDLVDANGKPEACLTNNRQKNRRKKQT